jgi:transcriptional regulator with XRE-family HTH domain
MDKSVCQDIRLIRKRLKLTQQQFASELGVAISSAVRWESTREPALPELASIYRFVCDRGMVEQAKPLKNALEKRLGLTVSYINSKAYAAT